MCAWGRQKDIFGYYSNQFHISGLPLFGSSLGLVWLILRYRTDLRTAPAEGLLSAVQFILGLPPQGRRAVPRQSKGYFCLVGFFLI